RSRTTHINTISSRCCDAIDPTGARRDVPLRVNGIASSLQKNDTYRALSIRPTYRSSQMTIAGRLLAAAHTLSARWRPSGTANETVPKRNANEPAARALRLCASGFGRHSRQTLIDQSAGQFISDTRLTQAQCYDTATIVISDCDLAGDRQRHWTV